MDELRYRSNKNGVIRSMNRKEITKLLSDMLRTDVLYGKYWANEVTFFHGEDGTIRIDFMKFEPKNQTVSGIEQGLFTAYEVKSCLADYRSKNGHNMIMDKNYYVMPMELYKKVVRELPHDVGVYVPIPYTKNKHEEFENPTPLEELAKMRTTMRCIKSCHPQDRKISNLTVLFCMFRSGYTV